MIDRTQTPPFRIPDRLSIPRAYSHRLANGVRFWNIPAGTQPLLRLSLVFHAGTRFQTAPFVASAMLNLLSEGAGPYSSAEIAERFDFYGIYYDTSIDRDYAFITISCLNRFLPQALDLLEQILLHPHFSERELAVYAAKRKQELIIDREKPGTRARERFSVALFGAEHPYGRVSEPEGYDTLTTAQVRDFYDHYLTSDSLMAVASGGIAPEQEGLLTAFLERLPAARTPAVEPPLPAPASVPRVREHTENPLQSSLRIGRLLFPKTHPDFDDMQVLATVLGGYFGSRLVKNLREERGYTYGIYAAMVNLEHTGYLAVASDVAVEATDQAIHEIFVEMERLRTERISSEELEMVRNVMIGEMMRILDGPFGIADVTIEYLQCGLDNEALHRFFERVRSITPAQLQKLAQTYLDPASFTTVVVGG